MPALSDRELEKVLESIFDELQQKGYINALSPKDKDYFIQNIIENLNTNGVSIQKEDLLDPNFEKHSAFLPSPKSSPSAIPN
jgi:hypothetical protein